MKKVLSILLAVMLLLLVSPVGLFSITASAATATSGTTGKCTWTLDGTVLTISGNGAMDSYYPPWGTTVTTVIIKNGVTSIGDYAFSSCTGLTSITIPDSVTSIGAYTFSGCSGLTGVTIPSGVKSIGNSAFYNCTGLTSITIPNSVTRIEGSAFSDCDSLKKVYITDLSAWCGIEFNGASANPLEYAKELYINGVLATDIKIPDTVKEIKFLAFSGYSGLTSITIPTSVTSIGDRAFYGCCGLTSVSIPDSVTSIGDIAFHDCTNLEYNIYETGKYLGNKSNKYLVLMDTTETDITSFKFADGVKFIYGAAFSGCNGLTSIIIPNSVTTIGDFAFNGCRGLTSVTIPASVTRIEGRAFDNCSGLNKVNITDLSAWCGITFVFSGYYSNNPLYYARNLYINDELATDITIPDTAKEINDYAFSYCRSLTSIAIPDSVTSIGNSAFYNCSGLTSVTIPDSASIGHQAFWDCTGLTSITIPDGASTGVYTFYGCRGLEELTIKTEKIQGGAFRNCDNLKKIYFSKQLTNIDSYTFNGANDITDIYYEGTAEEWKNVVIEANNGALNSENLNIYFNCTKIPDGIESVTLKTAPTKTEYIQGLEALDLTGGYLTVKYDDGATQNMALSTLTASGFKNSVLGEQTVTVRYGNYKVSFKVTVVKRKISNVSFAMPSIKEYILGDTPSTAGGGITVSYADGGRETKALTLDMISGYDMNKTGVQFVGIGYEGYEAYFKISVFRQGDTNGDGIIGALDISFLRKMLLGAAAGNNLCDVNRDGETDIRDLVRIKKLAAK